MDNKRYPKSPAEEHVAFRDGNYEEKRKIQKEITKEIHRSKQRYGKNIEKSFGQRDPKKAWEGLKTMTGCGRKNDLHVPPGNINSFVNELNQFYARFDAFDFRLANYDLCLELKTQVKDSEKN